MIKFACRVFSDRNTLRMMNRELRFNEVKQIYEDMSIADKSKELCREEYLYALKFMKFVKSKQPLPSPLDSIIQNKLYMNIMHSSPPTGEFVSFILKLLGGSLIIFYLYLQLNSKKPGNSPFDLISSKEHIHYVQSTDIRFSDVKGIDECRAELEEIVDFLKEPEKFVNAGGHMLKGVLLTGKPGTGKTLLAKAIAGEAGVSFFYCSGSDFDEMFVGIGAGRVRDLFARAKLYSPCIIFIDEIDALAKKRNKFDYAKSRQTLNQLLIEMDGFTRNHHVIVIGATNIPNELDPALKRSGRFDKVIDVPVPDLKGRIEIVNLYLDKIKHGEDVKTETIAKKAMGMTGADIRNIINIAALHAVKENREICQMVDMEHAIDRVKMGIEIRSYTMSESEIMNTAYHETGHALVGSLTKGCGDLHKVTILPRGYSLGHTSVLDSKEDKEKTKEEILGILDMLMGGRAAEEVFQGTDNITAGCSSDLKHATRIAYTAMANGMFSEVVGYTGIDKLENLSDKKRNTIDSAVISLLNESYKRALALISKNKALVQRISSELREKETLTGQEFKNLLKAA